MRFLIVVLVILMPVAASAQWTGNVTDEDLVKQFKRWSYYQEARVGGLADNEYSVTFMAPSLVKMWAGYETDEYSKKRIKSLYETITKHGYSVYVVGFKLYWRTSLDISPVKDNITLQIVEKEPKDYPPVAYSNNLNKTLMGANNNMFYGVVAYDTPPDMFAFQNLSLNAIWKIYDSNEYKKVSKVGPHQLQFSFMPNGVPRTYKQPQGSYAYFNLGTALDILSIGLQIVSMIK